MDIIHLLPDSVANQIAAGEVVQRPASVIKELMENAVDAGATCIDVIVENAGKTCIQVIDDGKGMSETDARMAFERHATSKILKAEDLFTLHTMGFRGEALPSIAAVAHVKLTTRTADSELGTEICIDGSKVTSQSPCACSVGANFEVRDLFFNIPARRKFLKSNQTEMLNITQEFERIALVNPSVSFTLTHNGTNVANLPASSLRQRIVGLFGKKFNEQLLPLDVDTTLVRLTGFVGKPEAARKKNACQFLFVNERYMRSSYFHKAVMEAYEHLIPEGEQIPYFLYFTVDPANIDVNRSPTKTEIKFENEAMIWPIIAAAVRDSLGKFNAVPTIDFDVEGRPDDIPVFDTTRTTPVRPPHININTNFNPFSSTASSSSSTDRDWEKLYAGLETKGQQSTGTTLISPAEEPDQMELFNAEDDYSQEMSTEHFQYRGQYILTPVQSGLMIVDQHRAHIRILYDKYRRQMESQGASSQGLLFPDIITLPPSDATLLEDVADELHNIGFNISPLGGGSFSILGVPPEIEGSSPVKVLTEMVEKMKEKEKEEGMQDSMRHRIALVMARNAAIVTGQVMTSREMEALLADLFMCQNPRLTPNGKTIVSILQQDEIERRF